MAPATPRPITGCSIPMAALGEDEAEVDEDVLEPVSDDPDVAVDPDLLVVLVALTEPVVTVLFLLPEGTMTPETDEAGLGTATRVEFATGEAGAGPVAGAVAASGWVVMGFGWEVAGVVTGSGCEVTTVGC